MKQISLIEMDGFLKGKCIPRDLKVNETNAEYLVRKFAEAEAKCAALAVENAGIKSAIPQLRDIDADNDNMDDVSLAEDFGFNHAIERMRRQIPETPATDAFLAEVRAQCLNAFIQHHSAELDAHIKNGGEQFDEKSVRIRDIIVSARLFREQIRKGGNQ